MFHHVSLLCWSVSDGFCTRWNWQRMAVAGTAGASLVLGLAGGALWGLAGLDGAEWWMEHGFRMHETCGHQMAKWVFSDVFSISRLRETNDDYMMNYDELLGVSGLSSCSKFELDRSIFDTPWKTCTSDDPGGSGLQVRRRNAFPHLLFRRLVRILDP